MTLAWLRVGPVVVVLTTTEAKRRDRTLKLTTITRVSLDGVMQGLGGADEERSDHPAGG
jgi:hypothetical protein